VAECGKETNTGFFFFRVPVDPPPTLYLPSVATAQLAASRLTEMVAFCQFWLVMARELIKSGSAQLSQHFELVIGYL